MAMSDEVRSNPRYKQPQKKVKKGFVESFIPLKGDKTNVIISKVIVLASIAALIIQLAAQDLDLGSCWVQVYNRMHTETETAGEYIRGLLNIPDNLEVLNIVTLGYKNEERKPYDEEKLSYDKLHRNTF